MKKAWIIARVANPSNTIDCLDLQLEVLRKYCTDLNCVVVGESKITGPAETAQEVLKDIILREDVDVIVSKSATRICRSLIDFTECCNMLKAHGKDLKLFVDAHMVMAYEEYYRVRGPFIRKELDKENR